MENGCDRASGPFAYSHCSVDTFGLNCAQHLGHQSSNVHPGARESHESFNDKDDSDYRREKKCVHEVSTIDILLTDTAVLKVVQDNTESFSLGHISNILSDNHRIILSCSYRILG